MDKKQGALYIDEAEKISDLDLCAKAEELEKSKNELEAILDASPEALIMVNREDVVVAADKQITEFFQVDNEDILSRPVGNFLEKIKDRLEDYDSFAGS